METTKVIVSTSLSVRVFSGVVGFEVNEGVLMLVDENLAVIAGFAEGTWTMFTVEDEQ